MEQRETDRIAAEEMGKLADLLRREGYEIHGIRTGRPYESGKYAGTAITVDIIRYAPVNNEE
jgi:hypothetical protein